MSAAGACGEGVGAHAAHPSPGLGLPPAALIPQPRSCLLVQGTLVGADQSTTSFTCREHPGSAGTVPSPAARLERVRRSDGCG